MKKLLTLTISFVLYSCIGSSPYAKELTEVKQKIRTEAKASWWGFDKKDSTKCLQAAIDSGVKKLFIDNVGSPWITGPVFLKSKQEIVFEDGVVIQAKKGAFKGKREYLFSADMKEDIILRGIGKVILKMRKKDYQDKKLYVHSEWRHGISIRSCNNVTIKNLTIRETGGDGMCIGGVWKSKQPYSKDILIEDVICDHNHRQGISITSVENLIIRNSKFDNTKGTPPQAGLDFEPDHRDERMVNCLVEDCEFNDNYRSGIVVHLPKLLENSIPVSITFKRCLVKGNGSGINIYSSVNHKRKVKGKIKKDFTESQVAGTISFIDCKVEKSEFFSLRITNQQDNGFKILFKDCIIDNTAAKRAPILFKTDVKKTFANVIFENMQVMDNYKRPVAVLQRDAGFGTEIKGKVILTGKDGKKTTVDLGKIPRSK